MEIRFIDIHTYTKYPCTAKANSTSTAPVSYKTLVLAEVTEEACIVQVHDSVLLPSDIHVHRQPVIC